MTLTRIRSNKKLPDPPPVPPRKLNKNRLFRGSSSAATSVWASSPAFDDKSLSDDTSLSKTQHHTGPLYYYFSFCGHNISCVYIYYISHIYIIYYYYIIGIHVCYISTRTVSIRRRHLWSFFFRPSCAEYRKLSGSDES